MLVGDSLMRNMMHSLDNLLQMHQEKLQNLFTNPPICEYWEEVGEIPSDFPLCKLVPTCGIPMYWVRNDRLEVGEREPYISYFTTPNWGKQLEFYLPWLSFIKLWGVKAVVLNRGTHFTPTEEFERELDLTLLTLRDRYPDLLVFYRATAPGHDGCEHMEIPLKVPQKREGLPFHWGFMDEQNIIAKRLVEKYGGVFLDIEWLASLRGDGHKIYPTINGTGYPDCLHYCHPGSVDTWNRLLFNALVRLV